MKSRKSRSSPLMPTPPPATQEDLDFLPNGSGAKWITAAQQSLIKVCRSGSRCPLRRTAGDSQERPDWRPLQSPPLGPPDAAGSDSGPISARLETLTRVTPVIRCLPLPIVRMGKLRLESKSGSDRGRRRSDWTPSSHMPR